MNLKNPHFEWIPWIKSKSEFLRFTIQAFFGKGLETNTAQAVFHTNLLSIVEKIFSYMCISQEVQTEALPRQDNFICVHFYNSGTDFERMSVLVYKLFVLHTSRNLRSTTEISFCFKYCVPPACLEVHFRI